MTEERSLFYYLSFICCNQTIFVDQLSIFQTVSTRSS